MQVHKLKPCGLRMCKGRIKKLYFRTCPLCRAHTEAYLPYSMVGGEHFLQAHDLIEINPIEFGQDDLFADYSVPPE